MIDETAWEETMLYEGSGKLHKTPGDPGGWTKWGISQRLLEKVRPGTKVKDLTEEDAKAIAEEVFWTPMKLDLLRNWNYPDYTSVQAILFDFAFNTGQTLMPVRHLQWAINLRNRRAELVLDGRLGPKTLTALKRCNTFEIEMLLAARRCVYYYNCKDPSNSKAGWLLRAMRYA
jgi:lysozyme family protein